MLNVVSEKPVPEPELSAVQREHNAAVALMRVAAQTTGMAISTISKRFVLAVYNSFAVGMFGVAAYLWYSVLQNITFDQTAACTIFSLFTLGMVKLVRKI